MIRLLKYHIVIIIVLLSLSQGALAQQDAMYTQYMFNGLALNPAYAGSHGAISSSFLLRKQWAGIEGSPTSQTLSIHSPLPDGKMGAGLMFTNDAVGISKETNVVGNYSYTLPLPFKGILAKGKLALGLSAGVTILNANYNDLALDDETDVQFSQGNLSGTKPNFGGGAYYYTEDLYFGIGIPRILENKFKSGDLFTFQQSRHYFITGGYVLPITSNFKFKPSFLVKAVSGAPVEIDLNGSILFIERFWVGISYRSFASLDFHAQFDINEQLRIGYAYDAATTDIRRYSKGSHEFILNYTFSYRKYNMLSPRYF